MTLSSFSGRIDTLESQVVQLFQELLLRVDIETLGNIQRVFNTRIDAVTTGDDVHETRLDNLEGLYSNIAYTVNAHIATFTGHTGTVTGDGVHGHV